MITYLVIINIVTFILFYIDKMQAIKDNWRIPEAVLLGLSLVGGSVGSIIGMYIFNHKIKKKKFSRGLIIMAIIQYIVLNSLGILGTPIFEGTSLFSAE